MQKIVSDDEKNEENAFGNFCVEAMYAHVRGKD